MTSPGARIEGATGSTMTSDPFWMVGSMEPPVTTKVAIPSVRIATMDMQIAKSPTVRTSETIFPAVLTAVSPIPTLELSSGARELRGGVGDREVLRQALERVACRGRKAEDE